MHYSAQYNYIIGVIRIPLTDSGGASYVSTCAKETLENNEDPHCLYCTVTNI